MVTPDTWFAIIMGLVVALIAEKYYIDRIGVLPNVAGIFFIMTPFWVLLPKYFKWWIYAGVIVGVILIVAYHNKHKIPSEIYSFTHLFYSGKTVMGIYIPTVIFREQFPNQLFTPIFWIASVFCVFFLWWLGWKYFNNKLPWPLNEFIPKISK